MGFRWWNRAPIIRFVMQRPAILALPVVALFGIAGFLLAAQIGTATGTSVDSSRSPFPAQKVCPASTPDDCRALAADAFHVDAAAFANVSAKTPGLEYKSGRVLLPKDGSAPVAEFTYAVSNTAVAANARPSYQILIAPRTVPKGDKRTVGTTTHGNKFREATGTQGVGGLVFFDEHFSYIVVSESGAALDKAPGALTLARELVDAVHLTSRRLDP